MRFKVIITLLMLLGLVVNAQQKLKDVDLRDILESMAETLPDDYDITELVDVLNRYRKHPINLNKTSPEELKTLIFLSPLQISNFFNYTQENGKFIDVLELQSINGFDPNTVELLIPFVTVNPISGYEKLNAKNLLKFGENDVFLRFAQVVEQQKGFTDLPGNRYLGTPQRLQSRYRYHYGSIFSAALTLDKDAGEKSTSIDFLSGNVALFKLGTIKKFVVGDYTMQFGQGLTLWSGFSFGKAPDVTSVAKKDLGLRPYTSANEYSFFRGAASTVQILKNIDLTGFISFRKLDASQDQSSDGSLKQSTINQTGLHRTPTEIENKDALKQDIYGAVIQYNNNDIAIGTIAYRSKYGNEFIPQAAPYDQFSFTGNKLTNLGVFYNYTYKNIYTFGEFAKSLGTGMASVNGALISLSPIVSAAITYRNYAENYHSFFNQAVSEASEAINEKGFYTGLNIIPNKRWSLSFYADYFRFPWLKYRVDAPSKGYELLAQLAYTPTKTFKVLGRFKKETKQQNTDLEEPIYFLDDVTRSNYRCEVSWQINKIWSFQNRLEVSQFKKGDANNEFGYLVYQDIDYSPMFSKITGNIRIAYFSTASYNSRIYAYEDDVLYSFAFGMYSGKGFRTYINTKLSIAKRLNLWCRYAMFYYRNVETVGTYLDEIQGNKKSELKIQLRYQF
ncbi:helix-hairpin-helix domain-containing protein [Pedobacter sandarakinus]|uniref:helix-hairpin-helix domain-containing protein n=1 Tax=Pedobacter sandarakinus TaxID=353156 RepID=UPI002246DE61|nr:helix-hairpin-helix domain-containing protein [Pedobacter sandarakinus]MCX2574266.1 helix-hairpin-helix domain-containing protein [Pedobacter sandarakinus]